VLVLRADGRAAVISFVEVLPKARRQVCLPANELGAANVQPALLKPGFQGSLEGHNTSSRERTAPDIMLAGGGDDAQQLLRSDDALLRLLQLLLCVAWRHHCARPLLIVALQSAAGIIDVSTDIGALAPLAVTS
jgi:hypothetical protein